MTQPATTPDGPDAAPRGTRRSAAAAAGATTRTPPTQEKVAAGNRKSSGPRRDATPSTSSAGVKTPGADIAALRTQLVETVRSHYPQANLTSVEEAFDLAVDAHKGQSRATGEPYVTHPIASAQITAELGIDPVAVTAALLHDVPEDTEYSLTHI